MCLRFVLNRQANIRPLDGVAVFFFVFLFYVYVFSGDAYCAHTYSDLPEKKIKWTTSETSNCPVMTLAYHSCSIPLNIGNVVK
jgi:hypothetical protein